MSRDGLGATAGLLCDVLATGDGSPVAVASIVAATGLTARTVRRWLRMLSAHGLVQPGGGGWHLSGDRGDRMELLDAAASRLGASGSVARRRVEYDTESTVWAWLLADLAAERGYASLRGRRRLGRGRMRRGEVAAPRAVFPRDEHGRAQWRSAMDLALAGLGLQVDELGRLDLAGHLAVGGSGPLTGAELSRLELAVGIATPVTPGTTGTGPGAALPTVARGTVPATPKPLGRGRGGTAPERTGRDERQRKRPGSCQLELGDDGSGVIAAGRHDRTVRRTPASRRRTSTQPRTRTTHRVHGTGATPRGDLLA